LFKDFLFKERRKDSKYFAKLGRTAKKNEKKPVCGRLFLLLMQFHFLFSLQRLLRSGKRRRKFRNQRRCRGR
jgi:hypothetical protein